MTEEDAVTQPPALQPTPAQVLDQAVIDAGRELAAAQLADPRDEQRIEDAREALRAARLARYGADA